MFTVISSFRAPHQLEHQKAMIAGLKAHGIDAKPSHSESHVNTKHVACWGWRLGKMLREKGHEVLVMERGYIGNRFRYTSLSWNGLNGRAQFPYYPDDRGQRFDQMATMKPWKYGGDYILMMGQVPSDQSLAGRDLLPWYADIAQQATDFYHLPVFFRQHPDLTKKGINQRPDHVLPSAVDLEEALSRAALVITYNSNSAVDAVLRGVPTLSFDQGSMAWEVTGHAIGDEIRPYRRSWANQLAWKQWSLDEIASGFALTGLVPMLG